MARSGMVVKGMSALTKKIKRIEKNVKKCIAVPVMRAAGKETAKVIKSRMNPLYKDARKSMGWRLRKASEMKKGMVSAKAGAGVGWSGKRKRAFIEKQKKRREKEERPGVGISPQNIHWWFLGTRYRKQRTTGKATGRMRVMELSVKQLANSGRSEIFNVQVQAGIRGLKKLIKS